MSPCTSKQDMGAGTPGKTGWAMGEPSHCQPATSTSRHLVGTGGGTVGQVQREEKMLVKFIHLNLAPPGARDGASVASGKLTILSVR